MNLEWFTPRSESQLNFQFKILCMLSISIQPVHSGHEFIFQQNTNILLFDRNNDVVFGNKIDFANYSRELFFQLSITLSKIDRL